MERLTEKYYLAEDHYMRCAEDCNVDIDCVDCPAHDKLVERLAVYEDTGLEPEEIACIRKCTNEDKAITKCPECMDDRIRELAEADKDGRVVVLPCKVGDMVYEINRIFDIDSGVRDEIFPKKIIGYGGNSLNKVWLIASGDYCNYDIFPSEFGKTVFLTREEAERAMEGRKDE